MAKNKSSLRAAMDRITNDVSSSIRHWTQVIELCERRASNDDPAWLKRSRQHERNVATTALKMIADTGKCPESLVLGEAAAELGVVKPPR